MTDQVKRTLSHPVVTVLLPLLVAGFMAWMQVQTRIAVLETRLDAHERASTELSIAVDSRLKTIEGDIKQILSRLH